MHGHLPAPDFQSRIPGYRWLSRQVSPLPRQMQSDETPSLSLAQSEAPSFQSLQTKGPCQGEGGKGVRMGVEWVHVNMHITPALREASLTTRYRNTGTPG